MNPFLHTHCKSIGWFLLSFVKEVTTKNKPQQPRTRPNNLERLTTTHFITGAVMQIFLKKKLRIFCYFGLSGFY